MFPAALRLEILMSYIIQLRLLSNSKFKSEHLAWDKFQATTNARDAVSAGIGFVYRKTWKLLTDHVLTIRPDDGTSLSSTLAIVTFARDLLLMDKTRVKRGATLIDVSVAAARCKKTDIQNGRATLVTALLTRRRHRLYPQFENLRLDRIDFDR